MLATTAVYRVWICLLWKYCQKGQQNTHIRKARRTMHATSVISSHFSNSWIGKVRELKSKGLGRGSNPGRTVQFLWRLRCDPSLPLLEQLVTTIRSWAKAAVYLWRSRCRCDRAYRCSLQSRDRSCCSHCSDSPAGTRSRTCPPHTLHISSHRPHTHVHTHHTGHLADKNFLIRMLYKDSYWLFLYCNSILSVSICVLSYVNKEMIDWLIDWTKIFRTSCIQSLLGCEWFLAQ